MAGEGPACSETTCREDVVRRQQREDGDILAQAVQVQVVPPEQARTGAAAGRNQARARRRNWAGGAILIRIRFWFLLVGLLLLVLRSAPRVFSPKRLRRGLKGTMAAGAEPGLRGGRNGPVQVTLRP